MAGAEAAADRPAGQLRLRRRAAAADALHRAGRRAQGSELRLRAKADWLVCHDVCIPESATLELQLPVVGADTTPGNTA